MNVTKYEIADAVDKLGEINARIAALQEQADDLKATLIAECNGGSAEFRGQQYKAKVSVVQSMKADWKVIAEKAGASAQLIRANSRPVVSNRVALFDL